LRHANSCSVVVALILPAMRRRGYASGPVPVHL